MRKFKTNGRIVSASHVWRTNPRLPGTARFAWVFRLCQLMQVEGDQATIRLVALAGQPVRVVPMGEVMPLPPKGQPLPWRLDA